MSNDNSHSGGIGFFGLLQVTFIALKLCGKIEWSWLCVLAPALIGVVAFILVVVVVIAYGLNEDRKEDRRMRMTWEERLKEMQDKKAKKQ
jgi:DMSO/TMAO reductase YedYZ heme-binding membrane subunit